jgi:hypothetical protein
VKPSNKKTLKLFLLNHSRKPKNARIQRRRPSAPRVHRFALQIGIAAELEEQPYHIVLAAGIVIYENFTS